jgi:hypothetical protein
MIFLEFLVVWMGEKLESSDARQTYFGISTLLQCPTFFQFDLLQKFIQN